MADEYQNFQISVGKTFPWHEVYGGPTKALVDFYTQSLGWTTQTMPMGESGEYTMLVANGTAVAGVMGTDIPGMESVPPQWSTYIGVDDVDARLAKCVELGAKVAVGPMDIPTVGRMVLIQDPFGAHVWLFTPNPRQN